MSFYTFRIVYPAPRLNLLIPAILTMLALLLIFGSPALAAAQEETETPVATEEVTVAPEPGDGDVIVNPGDGDVIINPPAENPPPETEGGFNVREFLLGALSGVAGALAAVFGIIGKLKNDKPALDAIEWLGKSIPVEALDKLNQLGQNLRDAGEVLDRVTDQKPNVASS